MKGKIFTVDEANRMLPLVSRIAEDIVGTYREVNQSLQAYEDEKARVAKDSSREGDLRRRDGEGIRRLGRQEPGCEEAREKGHARTGAGAAAYPGTMKKASSHRRSPRSSRSSKREPVAEA